MSSLRKAIPPPFWEYKKTHGKKVGRFKLTTDVKCLPGPWADPGRTILRDRILELLAGSKGVIYPVVHTLSLIKQEDGLYREAWNRNDHGKNEIFYGDLTGYGEGEAVRLLQESCQPLDIDVKSSRPATEAGIDLLLRSNVAWFGSPFNESHHFYEHMNDLDKWQSAPRCTFEGKTNMAVVRYPDIRDPTKTIEEIVNEWPPNRTEGNTKRFALLRCVGAKKSLDEEGTRVFIAAGTDTLATLFAMQILVNENKGELLKAAVGELTPEMTDNLQFEALFQFGHPTNKRKVQMVWPRQLTFEQISVSKEDAIYAVSELR
jgi:hypothetical protein